MPALVDLERLVKDFTAKGEKIVIVVPGAEPLLLLPLSEYERLTSSAQEVHQTKSTKPKTRLVSEPKATSPEPVDPLPGGVEDDDQYFPEPL